MLQVTWLGHSTVVIDLDGVRLVADPLLHRHAGLLRRRGPRPDPSAWAGADAVLLSHLHHDHAEVRSLRLLGDVPILTSTDNAAWAAAKGLTGRALGPEEWVQVGAPERGVRVRLVPAVHHSRPMPHRPGAAHGHLVQGPSGTIWVAGDTALYDDLRLLPAWGDAAIDLALVPIGGWGPRLSAGHMRPEEAAAACRMTGTARAIPVHWNTLHAPLVDRLPGDWMSAPGPEFVTALAREAPSCRPAVLRPGESWSP